MVATSAGPGPGAIGAVTDHAATSFDPAPTSTGAFLGTTQLKPGKFNVWGTIVAIYALATGIKGLQLINNQRWLDDMFNGVALIGAVALAGARLRAAQHERRIKAVDPDSTPSDADADPGTLTGTHR